MNKRGQMKLSFGMIFSIILIIVFLTFAFFAIKTFLGLSTSAQTGTTLNKLQTDVRAVWTSQQSSQQEVYDFPTKVQYVCFVDFSNPATGPAKPLYNSLNIAFHGTENVVLYPINSSDTNSKNIENIDLAKMTASENPFCIKNINGKVTMTLKKDFNENLVTITR